MTLRMAVLLAVVPATLGAQSQATKPMEGAWKVVEIVVTGADAENNPDPQPGMFIFGQRQDLNTRIGQQVVPLSRPVSETRLKLVRLE